MGALVPSAIINRAVKQLGGSLAVSNWQTEQTVPASLARAFYEPALEEVLRDYDWPFARVQQKLDLLVEGYSHERKFAYKYPPGCVCIRRLFNPYGGNRNDDLRSEQKFIICQIPNPPSPLTPNNAGNELGRYPYGGAPPPPPPGPPFKPFPVPHAPQTMVKALLCDHKDLCMEFTAGTSVVNDFPMDFQAAFMFKLAYYMAPGLTGGDPYKRQPEMLAQYKETLSTAGMHAGNEENQDPARLGEFIDTRFRMGPGRPGDGIFGSGAADGISGYNVQ